MALFWREDGTRTLSTSERREGGIRAIESACPEGLHVPSILHKLTHFIFTNIKYCYPNFTVEKNEMHKH